MKVKTIELRSDAINYLVAQLEAHESRCPWMLEQEGYAAWQSYERAWGNPIPQYISWVVGGPLLERLMDEKGLSTWKAPYGAPDKFVAGLIYSINMNDCMCYGPTPLIAAMRCYIFRSLGAEVDIPEELL